MPVADSDRDLGYVRLRLGVDRPDRRGLRRAGMARSMVRLFGHYIPRAFLLLAFGEWLAAADPTALRQALDPALRQALLQVVIDRYEELDTLL